MANAGTSGRGLLVSVGVATLAGAGLLYGWLNSPRRQAPPCNVPEEGSKSGGQSDLAETCGGEDQKTGSESLGLPDFNQVLGFWFGGSVKVNYKTKWWIF